MFRDGSPPDESIRRQVSPNVSQEALYADLSSDEDLVAALEREAADGDWHLLAAGGILLAAAFAAVVAFRQHLRNRRAGG